MNKTINYEQNLTDYVNRIQNDDNLKMIPENIFNEAVTNFDNNKKKLLYENYILAHGIGISAITLSSSLGLFGGPLGVAIGSGVGGIIWGICGAASTIVDRCIISNNNIPSQNDYKYYKAYKNSCFGIYKEFSDFFPNRFNNTYYDTIKIKINSEESCKLFGPDNEYEYFGTVTGLYSRFNLISIDSCNLVPNTNLNHQSVIQINHNVYIQ